MKLQVEKMLSETRAELKSFANMRRTRRRRRSARSSGLDDEEFGGCLNDCVRGEYRDRLIVVNPRLWLLRARSASLGAAGARERGRAAVRPRRERSRASRARWSCCAAASCPRMRIMSAQSFYMFIQARGLAAPSAALTPRRPCPLGV